MDYGARLHRPYDLLRPHIKRIRRLNFEDDSYGTWFQYSVAFIYRVGQKVSLFTIAVTV